MAKRKKGRDAQYGLIRETCEKKKKEKHTAPKQPQALMPLRAGCSWETSWLT